MAELTKTQIAYRLIRTRITSGSFRPGERLNISELATQSGMSTIPVREAIKQLQTEGLVELDTYRGVRVVSFSQAELRELYLIRAELEGLAGRLAAESATPTDIAKLENILADKKKNVAKVNTKFHKQIYRMAKSEQLYNMIMNLWDAWYLIDKGLALQHVKGQRAYSTKEHLDILDAIRNHDGILSDKLIHKHVLDAGDRVMSWIQKEGTFSNDK